MATRGCVVRQARCSSSQKFPCTLLIATILIITQHDAAAAPFFFFFFFFCVVVVVIVLAISIRPYRKSVVTPVGESNKTAPYIVVRSIRPGKLSRPTTIFHNSRQWTLCGFRKKGGRFTFGCKCRLKRERKLVFALFLFFLFAPPTLPSAPKDPYI